MGGEAPRQTFFFNFNYLINNFLPTSATLCYFLVLMNFSKNLIVRLFTLIMIKIFEIWKFQNFLQPWWTIKSDIEIQNFLQPWWTIKNVLEAI